ncbi:MAG TPA: hypothetical protein VIM07_04350 [Chitinophagaceae bacterium]
MTSQEHLEVTIRLWYCTVTELESMKEFLNNDKINTQFYRRLFIRNIFSVIETYLYVTKELVKNKLVIDKNTNQISWSDLTILNEKKAVLDTQGNVNVMDDFQKFEPSLRFTLNIFAKIFGADLPKYGDSNFEKLKKLSKRRNDITHPKSLEELVISDQEIIDTVSMFSWFMHTHTEINKKFLEWMIMKSEN